jgi:hypothetical protein
VFYQIPCPYLETCKWCAPATSFVMYLDLLEKRQSVWVSLSELAGSCAAIYLSTITSCNCGRHPLHAIKLYCSSSFIHANRKIMYWYLTPLHFYFTASAWPAIWAFFASSLLCPPWWHLHTRRRSPAVSFPTLVLNHASHIQIGPRRFISFGPTRGSRH